MKKITQYINTMYRPSYIVLCIGLAVISLASIAIAIHIRNEMLAGKSDIIYIYPKIIEELFLRVIVFIPTVLLVDLNERKKRS